ncbi:cupin domain-containing protein [Arthrobacter sp. 18067]|uniref:cupin domain-containing protein n=1 Tax=Arthrobacter sp. 18067 TaxID=2681413 RepID=UPI0013585A30|nr:cupin domain-containing protein [Arthrobacter sp. 18067]
MTTTTQTPGPGNAIAGTGRLDTSDFTPMTIDGESHGEVHFFRDDNAHQRLNRVAVWRLTAEQVPYESPYDFRSDETILILEGELEMTFEDGTVQVLRTGDVVSVLAGTRTTWRINSPFKKFVVEVGK